MARNFTRHTGKKASDRTSLYSAVLTVLTLACAILVSDVQAANAEKHAAMAMDANTGKVLHNSSGDELRHPASLTKIMTLYMAFELIEAGKLSYGTKIRFSAQAASQPPSKLGLDVGESIRLIDAIKALITKSANDVACAVAEHIGGSETRFARLMTEKARALGMKRTVFKNASGLPNEDQVTTARDMLTLAMRLQDDFPKHYELFKTQTFSYRGKTYRNHNRLLGKIRGVDGIKTGYIRASGFNLVSSVKRDGKYVVAAVFGGRTSKTRNAEMTSLLYKSLKRASTHQTRKPMLVATPKPMMRPSIPPRRPVLAEPIEVGRAEPQIAIARVRPNDVVQGRPTPSPAYANRPPQHQPTNEPPGRAPGTLQDQLALLLARSGVVDDTSGEGSREEPEQNVRGQVQGRVPNGPYQVQVGAFGSRQEAEQSLEAVIRRTNRLLADYVPITEPVNNGSRTLYRARFAGFGQAAATSTCHELRSLQIDCFVTSQR